ncbi:MAG TPA: histidine kinase [Steroidobacteraceae bacterium]
MTPRVRPPLVIVTAFWAYVAASNVIYAHSMQESLSAIDMPDVFAGWEARLLQHLFLYPLLLAGVWGSLRIGWQRLSGCLPLQLLIGGAFAAAASPALWLGEWLMNASSRHAHYQESWASASGVMHQMPGAELPVWLASATTFLLTYGFALALLSGFDFYRRFRDSQIRAAALERALAAAHLAALRMQLSPHSLFNLLHTIRGQIDWDPATARTMIVQLGDLLRRLLNAGEREYSRLADEMQFVRLYLELQQRRFTDRLAIEVPQPAALPPAWVPSLILQPLVENAVVHGLAGHQGPVIVRVSATGERGELILRVTNTVAAERPAREGGIGLRNVRDRLAIQFSERAALRSEPEADGEWIAEIRLPLLTEVLETAPAAGEAVGPAVSAEPL